MQRREFIGLIGATALSFPRPVYAQTKTDMPLVALVLVLRSDTTAAKERINALRKGLQEEGFIEGMNYSLAMRFAEGDLTRLPQHVRELGALNPRVVVTLGFGAAPAQRSYPEIPMVFSGVAADPIALGWVPSYAHPGGMITGNVMNAVGGEISLSSRRASLRLSSTSRPRKRPASSCPRPCWRSPMR